MYGHCNRFLFVGNPGTGKSALLNGLIGEPHFTSRPSWNGRGVTYELDEKVVPGLGIFMDTPGLADEEMKQKAAESITQALKRGGFYRIFFVLTDRAGRIHESDKATIRLILEAAPITNYSVIVNQVHPLWLDGLRATPGESPGTTAMQEWITTLMTGLPRVTTSIHFFPRDAALDNQVNVRYKVPETALRDVLCSPGMVIHSEQVIPVQVEQFAEVQNDLETQVRQLEANVERMRAEVEQMRIAMVEAERGAEKARSEADAAERRAQDAAAAAGQAVIAAESRAQRAHAEAEQAVIGAEGRAQRAHAEAEQAVISAEGRAQQARIEAAQALSHPYENTAGRVMFGIVTLGISEWYRNRDQPK